MGHKFAEIAFTPRIRDIQVAKGSRSSYARMDTGEDYNHVLTERETEFISARDSFYMASVSETGWPYLQHRGGPAGFVKILDEHTLGFADYSGNRQYLSRGNFIGDNRVALFFMDYPNRRRLKMLGRVQLVGSDDIERLAALEDRDYAAQLEGGFVIKVEAFDWNCPAHITPRFSETELGDLLQDLGEENRELRSAYAPAPGQAANDDHTSPAAAGFAKVLGDGPLELVVSGVRQLAPRVRAFEFRRPSGDELPEVEAGSHLRIPVRLADGSLVERHYSIASNPTRRDAWEIAVLNEADGSGGSAAIHESYQIGTRLRVEPPANHFALHEDDRSAVLIAGGIGITPIKSMAQALEARGSDFQLHYAGRSALEMAYSDRLQRQFGDSLRLYSAEDGERMSLHSLLSEAPEGAIFYACGPARLLTGLQEAAAKLGIPNNRIRLELFS